MRPEARGSACDLAQACLATLERKLARRPALRALLKAIEQIPAIQTAVLDGPNAML